MNKKIPLLVFISASLLLCLVPSVGMIFRPTAEAVGNEQASKLPALKNDDGSPNFKYMSQLGDYFSKHFAFRPEAITADARIQSGLFKTPNVDSVVTGSDGWLYYSSTVNDYLGRNTLDDWEVKGVVNNLGIIQSYSKANGADFLFTVAPNKCTLYPEHFPYYYQKVSDVHNRDLVGKALEESDVNYFNLFPVFEGQGETLYFERDSHWNNKGALLAYNKLADALGKAHDDYSAAEVTRRKDFEGDLSKMIFPAGTEPEYNFYYGAEDKFRYVTDTKSVEESFIQTESDSTGTLYMYRDSFGNALLPFFAGAYRNATFTKSFPMILPTDFEKVHPDTFVMEIAERNIGWFIERPPVLLSPELTVFSTEDQLGQKLDATVKPCEFSPAYLEASGTLPTEYSGAETVCVKLTDKNGKSQTRECYTLSKDGRRGYLCYFNASDFDAGAKTDASVIIKTESGFCELGSATLTIGGISE